jgi:hypothetical protein
MPDCYLVAVTQGSALDRYTNLWGLHFLVERITFKTDQPIEPAFPAPH